MKNEYLKRIVYAALAEDIGQGDVTTDALVDKKSSVEAQIIMKTEGVICGLDIVQHVFRSLSKKISFKRLVNDGTKVNKQTIVAIIKGPARALLTGERVALNFLTHMSAIATRTRNFVEQVKPYSSKILDTRKTTPLLRPIERYAVQKGGGENHRFDLFEMAMIKDNHRLLLNKNLKEAVDLIKAKTHKKVILEVDTWSEFREALNSKAEIILLDNMKPLQVQRCVHLRNKLKPGVLLEASGGIVLNNVRAYAKTGVDRISIGSLTSVIEGIDISLDFKI